MTETAPIVLPAGDYWIGDPCYAISPERWHDFLHSINHVTGQANKDGQQCAVFRTHGDGTFPDQQKRLYPVDSGMIAAIPKAATDTPPPGYPSLTTMGQFVKSEQPLQCFSRQHSISFGPVAIHCK